MKIVIADDDASQRHYLGTLLRRMGHEVMVAEDGRGALVLLETSSAAMLICDVDMPGMDGLTLARVVRERCFGRYVYVLMITGYDRREDRVAGLEAGADDFMNKPVDASILALRVRAAERLVAYEAQLQTSHDWLQEAYATIRQDLEAAARAQQHLLPPASGRLSSCHFSTQFLPSSAVSGDVFGYFPLTPGILGFYAADVCGHGVRAALSAVALAHLITPEYFWAAVCAAPAEGNVICTADLVEALDSRFMGSDDDNYFTLFAGALVEASDELRFCQAGYPSPLLIRANGVTEWVGSGGMPVGMLPNAEFECDSVTLRPGDRLVVYSDGVIEAENPQGESFGEERLADFICLRPDQPANSVLAELSAHLRNWTTNEVFADDISMILIERE